jgi:hypothetical protein
MFKKYIVFFLIFFSKLVFSQGVSCNLAEPACAGGGFVFENTSNGSSGQNGPNYGCLGSVPNPSWFYFNVAASGNIDFSIEQNTQADLNGTGLDVDFICYGPFTNTDDYCNMLTSANTLDCSFSENFIESFTIPNAIQGELYILLITNYSEQPGYINLAQGSSSSGTTDCSIVVDSIKLCETDTYSIDVTSSISESTYSWTFDDGSGPIDISGENSSTLNIPIDLDGDSIIDPISGDYIATIVNSSGSNLVINNITYNTIPEIYSVPNIRICDNDGLEDTFTEFDFTNQIITALGDQTDVNISFHLSSLDAQTNTNPINLGTDNLYTNITNPQEIFIRLENSENSNCIDTAGFMISTDVELFANTPIEDEIRLCDNGNYNIEVFDLVTEFENIVVGDQLNLEVSYYDSNNVLITNPMLLL